MQVELIHNEKPSEDLTLQIYRGQSSVTAGLLNPARHIRLTVQMPHAEFDALPPDRIRHIRECLMTAYGVVAKEQIQ